jgi:DNA-binding transcriptional ArsR family regulator
VKRDEDLLRDILFQLEKHSDYIVLDFSVDKGTDIDGRTIYGHLLLLGDAGLVEIGGKDRETARITNAGHDFIAAIRDDNHWSQTKKIAESVGAKTVGILFDVAIELAKQRLKRLWEDGV